MNIIPLYEYVAAQANTNIRIYDRKSGALTERILCAESAPDFAALYPAVRTWFLERSPADFPMLTFLNDYTCHAHFLSDDHVIVLGPFHMQYSGSPLHSRHRLAVEAAGSQVCAQVPSVYPAYAMRDILLLFNCHSLVPLTEQACFARNFSGEHIREEVQQKTSAAVFSNRENQKSHNPYTQEVRLQNAIERGDLDALRKIWNEPAAGSLGSTARDPVRNGKNMAIYNVTFSGRAAIRAGISAEYIFSLTDSYCQQIEDLKDMLLLKSLVEDAQVHFTQLVADLKKGHTTDKKEPALVARCRDYVFQHLHSALTIREIADALNVHPSYLGAQFRDSEGMSLYQYILCQKIELTKNLLTYSDYSYLEIAHYLGFVSQSHLGARFRSATGMTLKQYRDQYRKKEHKID